MTEALYPRMLLPMRVSTVRRIGVFVIGWITFASYYVYLDEMDALLLWLVLPLPFGTMFLVAWRSRHVVLTLFMGAVFLSHAVLPPIFFTQKDRFTYSGWGAVKDFDFNVLHFLEIYVPILFFIPIVLIATLLLWQIIFQQKRDPVLIVEESHSGGATHGMPSWYLPAVGSGCVRSACGATQGQHGYGVLFMLAIALAGVTNNWMYSRGIAMTGLIGSHTHLPFRLAGILYYFSRFVIPVLLFLIYMRTSRSFIFATLLAFYALWAGLSQVSRFTLVMLFLPALFFCVSDRRYLRLGVMLLVLLSAYHWVSRARNFVYVISDGTAHANLSLSLATLGWQTILDYGVVSPIDPLFSLIGRLGGAQDVVLASQYDTAAMGGSVSEFQRHFLFGSHVLGSQVAQALYGFVPPRGFSPGSGGFASRILQIAGSNWCVLIGLSIWTAALLTVGEWIVRCYSRLFRSMDIGYMVGGVYIVLLYFLGFPVWLYTFIICAWLMLPFLRTSRRLKKLHSQMLFSGP